MSRHTNREIAEAKMLGKKLSTLQESRTTTSVSHTWSATTLFFLALFQLVRNQTRRTVGRIRFGFRRGWNALSGRRFQCPHCLSLRNLPEDNTNLKCILCSSHGFITQSQRESWAYGRMLLHWRGDHRVSNSRAAEMLNIMPLQVPRLENGYVPLEDWPRTAREVAEQQMRDEFQAL